MTKRLLAKINLLEKLAKYGDRKSFLEAIAQAPALDPNAIKQMLHTVVKQAHDFWQSNPKAFSMAARQALNPLMHDPDIKAMNTKGMQKAVQHAKELASALLASPQTRTIGFTLEKTIESFAQTVKQYLASSNKLTSLIEPQQEHKPTEIPTVNITGKPSSPVIADVQKRLTQLGYGALVGAVDGILGPKTQAALNKFKEDAPQYKGLLGTALYDAVLNATK